MRDGPFGVIRCDALAAGVFDMLAATVFGARRVVGVSRVFVGVFFVGALIIAGSSRASAPVGASADASIAAVSGISGCDSEAGVSLR